MVAITQDRLESCRRYAKLDECDDETIIELMGMAVEYLEGAGVSEPPEWSSRYSLAVNALTLHYYDHRDDIDAQSAHPQALRAVINQLKMDAVVATAVGEASE